MKKILSIALAIAMVLSLGVCSFAATIESENGSTTTDVIIGVGDLTPAEKVYYVEVTWESLTFTYSKGTQGEWDETTHTYGDTTGAGWDKTSATISVENHSNATVNVAAGFSNGESLENSKTTSGVTATVTVNNASLVMPAINEDVVNNPSPDGTIGTITVSVADAPDVDNQFTLGTITISISAA